MYEIIESANDVAFQHLAARELRPDRQTMWTIAGACIIAEPSRHRSGVPADAHCVRYRVENPEEAWTFVARAVWRMGRLHTPLATHVRIETYWDDEDRYGGDDAVAEAVNEWFRSLG